MTATAGRVSFVRRFLRHRGAVVGLGYMVLVIAVLVVGPALPWVQDPLAQDLRAVLQDPSAGHWLGTDEAGRDVLARLIHGGRQDLLAATAAAALAFAVGVPLGLTVGLAGRRVDTVVMRVVEAVQALPGIVLLTAVIAVLGRGVWSATIALGVGFSFLFLYTTRTEVRAASRRLYVDSARTLGLPPVRVAVRHVLPNVAGSILVTATTVLGLALLTLAGLSLLGLGAQPPEPSWGGMLAQASQNMYVQFFAIMPPGLALASVVFATNLIADGARDSLAGRSRAPRAHAPLRLVAPRRTGPAAPSGATGRSGATGPSPVLSVRGLTVRAGTPHGGSTTLVSDVDLDVGPGEIVGLVGASGSGKTTTASAVLGLLPQGVTAEARRLRIAGTDLQAMDARALGSAVATSAGLVPQDPVGALDPCIRIADQVGDVLRVHRGASRAHARARALELLAEVGIADPDRVADAYPHELSGGMAQRVMVASALAAEPALIVADEPTTALDVTVQSQVLTLLRRVRDDHGTGVLFITHDLAVVADLCDRVVVMSGGRIVESAPVGPLFAGPAHPATRELLAAARTGPLDVAAPAAPAAVPGMRGPS
ncbi:MAG: dipeptide/oligopeptide/nickel ABC transporter permease/ATP-binding protein [Kineosporiaceae bacterium]